MAARRATWRAMWAGGMAAIRGAAARSAWICPSAIAQPAAPAGGFGVDDEVGQWAGVVSEYLGESGRAGVGEDLGWVLAGWEGRGGELLGERDE